MTPTTIPSGWLTNRQAAERIGIHPVTLAAWRTKNRGPEYTKLGSGPKAHIRYRVEAVDAWMRSEKVAVAS